jgi:hypothetical protein
VKLKEGRTTRFDADDLELWISVLYKFREPDYVLIRQNRDEVYHIILLASAVKAKIERLHPRFLYSRTLRSVKGYETRVF